MSVRWSPQLRVACAAWMAALLVAAALVTALPFPATAQSDGPTSDSPTSPSGDSHPPQTSTDNKSKNSTSTHDRDHRRDVRPRVHGLGVLPLLPELLGNPQPNQPGGNGNGGKGSGGTAVNTPPQNTPSDGTNPPCDNCKKGSTETTEKPPPNGPPPNGPPTGGAAPNPQPVTPSDQPRGNTAQTPVDCPQRDKGCAALVIDFSRWIWHEPDLENVSNELKKKSCPNLVYVAPKLKPVPYPYEVEVSVPSPMGGVFITKTETVNPDPKDVAEAEKANEKPWQDMLDAIAKHREAVSAGVELAVEMLNGHGSRSRMCGAVGAQTGNDLWRDDFHTGNYKAAFHNVCRWFAADFTCYSGLTPAAFDQLNNSAVAACHAAKPPDVCAKHAGFESDIAVASSKATEECTRTDKLWLRGDILPAMEAFRWAGAGNGETSSFPAYYRDHGYGSKLCIGADRKGY